MKNTNPLGTPFHVFGRFSLVGIIATFIYFISANLLIYTNIVSPIKKILALKFFVFYEK
jgi:putative flippase GtrA